jgi:DNA-binding transcriptional regulator YdaS (Cro superfamily)
MRAMDDVPPSERRELATLLGLDEQYLYQCFTGRKAMHPKEAMRAERKTSGRLRRWHLRPLDWHEIWPELIGTAGSPPVPAKEASGAS